MHLADDWVNVARPTRPFARVVTNRALPPGTDTLNVPKVLTGSATSAHADLGVVQETDPTTGVTSVPVKTLAGQVDVSRQALDRSAPGLDEIIFADLRADYDMRLDLQILTGLGSGANAKGVLSDSNRLSVTWTQASPTVQLFGNQVADAQQQIYAQTFRAPTHLILHPRRWSWILAAADSTGRPLISPQGAQVNSPGTATAAIGEGAVGVFQNLSVILDANLPTNLGAGTNQDAVIVTAAAQNYLCELPGGPVLKVDEEVLSGNLAVRLQAYSYFAFTSELRSKANAEIIGTGLVPPAFPD